MSKWGSVRVEGLEEFYKEFKDLEANIDEIYEALAKECAARLLALVIKRTLPGKYPNSSKLGGTLRRGWTARTEKEAQNKKATKPSKYAQSLEVVKQGASYVIVVTNPVHYASYVEYGHRTRDHKNWVEGRFMLTISENELRVKLPGILERKVKKLLKEAKVFGE